MLLSEGKDKGQLIEEILSLFSDVSDKLGPEALGMKDWMAAHFHNPEIVELIQDSTVTMLRVLDAIGQLEPVNGITISKQYRIPKGSVSKATRRLIARQLITTESLPNNKKEVLFRTTPLGRELFTAHRAFDQQMGQGFIQFLKRYEDDELRFITRVLHDVLEARFLEPAPQVENQK